MLFSPTGTWTRRRALQIARYKPRILRPRWIPPIGDCRNPQRQNRNGPAYTGWGSDLGPPPRREKPSAVRRIRFFPLNIPVYSFCRVGVRLPKYRCMAARVGSSVPAASAAKSISITLSLYVTGSSSGTGEVSSVTEGDDVEGSVSSVVAAPGASASG